MGQTTVVGVDVGATLAKLAVRDGDGALSFRFLSARDVDSLIEQVRDLAPDGIGLTGCGATALEHRFGQTPHRLFEFEAWAEGSRALLREQQQDVGEPYLLVSVGTGTSVLRVGPEGVSRLGGTALGGGTLLGLGSTLTGATDYPSLCALATAGRRGNVDLLIGDIFEPGEIALPGEATAAAFGSLAHRVRDAPHTEGTEPIRDPSAADFASAVIGLVGENVALLTVAVAKQVDVRRVVFGGGSLVGNEPLRATLAGITTASGFEPVLLDEPGYVGALGALDHASARIDG